MPRLEVKSSLLPSFNLAQRGLGSNFRKESRTSPQFSVCRSFPANWLHHYRRISTLSDPRSLLFPPPRACNVIQPHPLSCRLTRYHTRQRLLDTSNLCPKLNQSPSTPGTPPPVRYQLCNPLNRRRNLLTFPDGHVVCQTVEDCGSSTVRRVANFPPLTLAYRPV
jgi:hypothetical protein